MVLKLSQKYSTSVESQPLWYLAASCWCGAVYRLEVLLHVENRLVGVRPSVKARFLRSAELHYIASNSSELYTVVVKSSFYK